MMISKYCLPKNCKTFERCVYDLLGEIEIVKTKKCSYINAPSVFDIEASSFYENNEKRCCMYAANFGFNGRCVKIRRWSEFINIIKIFISYYHLDIKNRMIIYVHNLSYDFQFFRKYFEWEKVFSMEERTPIYALTKNGIEFRCSYLLSGYSLDILAKNLTKYKVNKMVGDLDYNLIRTSETPMTEKEDGYLLNDGLVVMAHIQEEIERLGDISKIPLTKTGYVRDLCRQKTLKGDNRWDYSKTIKNLTMNLDDYLQLKRGFIGGFTHANIMYANKIMYNIHSFDFTSSYPAVMIAEKFPMSKPYRYNPTDFNDFIKMLKSFCCIFDCKFINIVSKVKYENYISVSRCKAEHYITNNGRIMEASSLDITLTEQDFFIISKLYSWDSIEISNFKYFYKGYLPKDFIMTILELYKSKTELKGVEGKEVEYMVSKNMLNSCYGMCVTDVCRDEITYSDNEWGKNCVNKDEIINDYNKSRTRFLFYPWGIWVTAYARRNLFSGIIEFGEDYIYSDTDSIKVKNIEKHKEYIEEYNKNITEKIRKCFDFYNIDLYYASPKTIKGESKPIGVWDYEGMYNRFKTLGAKRYIVEKNGDISITVSGVNKTSGVEYLKYKYKTNDNIFRNFEENLIFPAEYYDTDIKNASGKLTHSYIDFHIEGEVKDYMGNIYYYSEESGVHLEPANYKMSLDAQFANLILGYKENYIL